MGRLKKFYQDKRVFITGHTGFKGTWLTQVLSEWGAELAGFSLPLDKNFHFQSLDLDSEIKSYYGDIRDKKKLNDCIKDFRPEIVFHLAAQAIVHEAYKDPISTYETNVIGSLHLLEILRDCSFSKALVYITSDKCYENNEWVWGYRETDRLGGFDPYSASKAAAEILFGSHTRSFLNGLNQLSCASARAGNVIGGGDYSPDRIIPDCVRAAENNGVVAIRNPKATRPWQHVLEPLSGYLTLAQELFENNVEKGSVWNFGPSSGQVITVEELAKIIFEVLGNGSFEIKQTDNALHEAGLLQLNCDKAHQLLGWKPKWTGEQAIFKTASWYADVLQGLPVKEVTNQQIGEYFCVK